MRKVGEEIGSTRWIGRVAAVVLAFFAGAANALFGGGGGMLVVPALGKCLRIEEKRSHATAVAVMLPLSLCSAIVYSLRGVYDISSALAVTGGAVLGGGVGALLLKKMPIGCLSILFYCIMIYAGIKYLG